MTDEHEATVGAVEVKTTQTSVQTPYSYATRKRGRKPKKKAKRLLPVDKTNYCEYSTEDMNEAIELVHGGMGVIDAALKYGIPRATLFNRSREGCKTHTGRCSEVFLRTHVGQDFPKKRSKSHYTPATVERAIEDVHNGMPVIDAAILYDIPRATLFIRSGKGCPTHKGRCATVSTNGKLKRTKVSRFRYLKLMQQKSTGKSTKTSVEEETSGSSPEATASSLTVSEASQIPAGFSPKVKLLKISDEADAQPIPQNEDDDDVEQPASDIKSDEMGSSEPVMGMSTSQIVFETGSSEQALQTAALGSSDQLFETLSGTIVVKIERDVDD